MRRLLTLSDLFPNPPFQPPALMDSSAERVVTDWVSTKYGAVRYPIPTEALTCLLERDTTDLDLYFDFGDDGMNVDGVTDFEYGAKPRVRIAARLSGSPNEHRLRTTVAHEYGHVFLHNRLVQTALQQGRLLNPEDTVTHRSYRDTARPKAGNLIEYQAWYFGAALLMPKTPLLRLVSGFLEDAGSFGGIHQDSEVGFQLQQEIGKAFGVSQEAARIRLLKLRCLSDTAPEPSLF